MRSQNSKCAKENNGKPCLWKSSAGDGINDSPSLDAVHRRFASRPQKKDFFSLCSTALVVAQEFALSCFLLARHRIALYFEQSRSTPENAFTISQTNLDQATVAMSAALMLVLFCSSRSNTIPRQKRREKAQQRLSDAILLGIVLRLLASVLRTLTASYSSDTVEALATTGMTLHVVACDYSYANGRRPHGEIIRPLISSQRPVFRGGTFSLNAALFATTLLVSRVESNSMAYFLISLAIVMFAFYPDARHAIANSYPPSRSGFPWLITAAISGSTLVLLNNHEKILFLVGMTSLVFVVPLWNYISQCNKVWFRGPWDIPTRSSMKLDNKL